jgi:hypothetical protein
VASHYKYRCHQLHARCLAAGCRLEDIGFGVGLRLLEILSFREKGSKRDIRLLDVLKFVHTSLWKYLFGHQARDLEQSNTVSSQLSAGVYISLPGVDILPLSLG